MLHVTENTCKGKLLNYNEHVCEIIIKKQKMKKRNNK